ncbi:MAG: hypothetical protein J0H11_04045, partial [Rhizobiales bacterium]|nr:hypothetical protein [Hyphomicrobiales bacterium]
VSQQPQIIQSASPSQQLPPPYNPSNPPPQDPKLRDEFFVSQTTASSASLADIYVPAGPVSTPILQQSSGRRF